DADVDACLIAEFADRGIAGLARKRQRREATDRRERVGFRVAVEMNLLQQHAGERSVTERPGGELVSAFGRKRQIGADGGAGVRLRGHADGHDAIHAVVNPADAADDDCPDRAAEKGGIAAQREFVLLKVAAETECLRRVAYRDGGAGKPSRRKGIVGADGRRSRYARIVRESRLAGVERKRSDTAGDPGTEAADTALPLRD